MSPTKSMIALLFALGSSGALAQNTVSPQPPTGKPVSDSASYGPVLNPQTPPATSTQATQAAGEARPQAQEERAGQPPVTSKQNEVDPSARPAPGSSPPQGQAQPQTRQQNQQPMTEQEKRGQPERTQQNKKQAQRRPGAVQQIESTPRIVAPAPSLTPRAPLPGVSAPAGPQTSQVIGCTGSACTDVNGGSYNASGPGNTTVSSSGRLCTRNGANMQCI